MSILVKTLDIHVYPWVIWFSCKISLRTHLCLGICMYTCSFNKTYIYHEAYLVWWFSRFWERFLWASLPSFMIMLFTWLLYTHIILSLLITLFLWVPCWALYITECLFCVKYMLHEIYDLALCFWRIYN